MKTLALEILHPPDYPTELVDRVQDILGPSLHQWGIETFTSLKRHLRKHPTEKSAIMLSGLGTPLSHEGQPICALFAMKYCHGDSHPEFTCFIVTEDKIAPEKNRILEEVQSESVSRKLKTTIAEVR